MPHLEVKLGALEAHERREHRRDPGRASGKQHQPSDEIVRDNHLPEQAQGRLGFKRPAEADGEQERSSHLDLRLANDLDHGHVVYVLHFRRRRRRRRSRRYMFGAHRTA